MEEGEGKLQLIGSRKFGMKSLSEKRKQTWKLMAERVRCDAMGNREPLRILEQGNGLVRLSGGKTHSIPGGTVAESRGLLPVGKMLQLVEGNSPWLAQFLMVRKEKQNAFLM